MKNSKTKETCISCQDLDQAQFCKNLSQHLHPTKKLCTKFHCNPVSGFGKLSKIKKHVSDVRTTNSTMF